MTLIDVKNNVLYPQRPLSLAGTFGFGNSRVNATGEEFAINLEIPFDCTITEIGTRFGAVVSGGTVTGAIQTYDITTGEPDGTDLATFSGTVSAVGYVSFTLDSSLAVSRNDKLSIVFKHSGTLDYSVSTSPDFGANNMIPHPSLKTTAYAPVANSCIGHVKLDDGTYLDITGLNAIESTGTTSFDNATTEKMVGSLITVPYTCTANGIWFQYDHNAATHKLRVYESDGTTLVWESSEFSRLGDTVAPETAFVYFDSDLDITAGDSFYIVLVPTSLTNVLVPYVDAPSSSLRSTFPGGDNNYYVHADTQSPTGTGDWTANTSRLAFCGFRISQIDDGTGSGSGGTECNYGFM